MPDIEAVDDHRVSGLVEDAERASSNEPVRSQTPEGTTVPEPDRERIGRLKLRLVGVLLALLRLGPLLILVILIVVLANLSPVFATHPEPRATCSSQSAAIAILAIGQLLVILTRGIDLSVGSTLALSAVVGALVFGSTGQRRAHRPRDARRPARWSVRSTASATSSADCPTPSSSRSRR